VSIAFESAAEAAPRASALQSREDLLALKARDNVTNFRYIARIYLVIVTSLIAAIWAAEAYRANDLSLIWTIAISVPAMLAIGASQHQLGAIIHEGTHFTLFKDRNLNEIVSDWLGGFPIYTSTQAYRLHHYAHHQFVNDPDRDPIATQAAESNHWLDFPVTHMELLLGFLKLIWPLNLLRYMLSRAKHSALPQTSNPFTGGDEPNPWAIRTGILFAVGVPFVLIGLLLAEQFFSAFAFLAISYGAMLTFYLTIPEADFPQTRIRPVISDRTTIIARMTYLGIVYGALTIIYAATGVPAWGYFALFWILPLFTAFPVFMVLREWIQHGNADRGRLTNSRVFLVDPISRYAVFPLGMDYHLPHHLMAAVPHYNLKRLHELMMKDPEYAEKCRVVDGWTGVNARGEPSIVEVLGPDFTVRNDEIYIDEATHEEAELRDAEAVAAHVKASQSGRIW
jgi:fatty acid desaturase